MSYLLYHRIGSAKHRLVAVTASAEFPLEYIEEHLRAARLRSVIVNSRTAMTLVWRSLAVVALCDDDSRLLTKAIDNVLTPGDNDDPIVDSSIDAVDRQTAVVSISESIAPLSPCLSFNPPPVVVQVPVTPPQSTSQRSLIACNKVKQNEEEEQVLQRGSALSNKRQRVGLVVAPLPDSGSSSSSFADGIDPNSIAF